MRLVVAFFVVSLTAAIASAAEQKPFDEWKADIQSQARQRGISEATVALLDNVEPDPRVIEFDRNQPEFQQTFEEYLTARVTPEKIRLARRYYEEHLDTLNAISDHYQVDPEYLIAFWGLESGFGNYQGKYSVLRSLATLAHDPRRSEFFTRELLSAMQILDEGHIEPENFVGGWAGAMGQNQFLPSSFLKFAQDFDGDGRKNIWTDEADVWASIAYYLAGNGWEMDAGWGGRVDIPPELGVESLKPKEYPKSCLALRNLTASYSPYQWKQLGLTGDVDSLEYPEYALILPEEGSLKSWLVGANFYAILDYNCANKYAVSVGLLADMIVGR